jgi:hypothetical protein
MYDIAVDWWENFGEVLFAFGEPQDTHKGDGKD